MRTIELMEIEFVFIINTSKKNKTIYQTVYMLFYKKKKIIMHFTIYSDQSWK